MFGMRSCSLFRFVMSNLSAYVYIEQLKIPVLCLVVYSNCFAFCCISAVLRDRCWFCCSILTATIIKEHYYDVLSRIFYSRRVHCTLREINLRNFEISKLECSQPKTDRCSCWTMSFCTLFNFYVLLIFSLHKCSFYHVSVCKIRYNLVVSGYVEKFFVKQTLSLFGKIHATPSGG